MARASKAGRHRRKPHIAAMLSALVALAFRFCPTGLCAPTNTARMARRRKRTRRPAAVERRTTPCAFEQCRSQDQQTQLANDYGATCLTRGRGISIRLSHFNSEGMAPTLIAPNITLILLPSKYLELNPVATPGNSCWAIDSRTGSRNPRERPRPLYFDKKIGSSSVEQPRRSRHWKMEIGVGVMINGIW